MLDCRPPLLPVSMDISAGVLPPEREQLFGGGDLLSLICPELGVTPLVDPGTDVEDERPTPAVSPLPIVTELRWFIGDVTRQC